MEDGNDVMDSSLSGREKTRPDIQALRGFAVIIVMVFHAKLGVLESGFLGVDTFFVVSGFLITRIISRDIKRSQFSFRGFYFRRARRLLPAAYTVLALTTLGGAVLLTASQFRDFTAQLVGSIFFSANFVLWGQTGYFAESAYMRPLLHMWSLGIEEQYYLAFPILMALCPRRFWLPMIIAGTVASFALCLWFVYSRPSFAFFMLPTRAWELGIGSAAALLRSSPAVLMVASRMAWPAVVVLLAIPAAPLPSPHPGVSALAVCFATAIIILAEAPKLNRGPIVSTLARVGDASYSLYLVHFPLFALARTSFMTVDLPLWLILALLAASAIGGAALYRFVEQPTRHGQINPKRFIQALVASGAILAIFPAAARAIKTPSDAVPVTRADPCISTDPLIDAYEPTCAQSHAPEVLIWGDSIAGRLLPSIDTTTVAPLDIASKGMCAPIVGIAASEQPFDLRFAETCLAYSQSVIGHLARTPSIRTVVITGAFTRFYTEGSGIVGSGPVEERFTETIDYLHKLGKRVVLVTPPPQPPFDIARCLERRAEHLPAFGRFADCRFTKAEIIPEQRRALTLLVTIAAKENIPLIRLDNVLCSARCVTSVGGKSLYMDAMHLSDYGAKLVGRHLDLGKQATQTAR